MQVYYSFSHKFNETNIKKSTKTNLLLSEKQNNFKIIISQNIRNIILFYFI